MEEGEISHEDKLFKADFYRHLNGTSGNGSWKFMCMSGSPLWKIWALREVLNADISTKDISTKSLTGHLI